MSVADGKQKTHWFYNHQTNHVAVYSTSEYNHFTGIRFWVTGKQYTIRTRPDVKDNEKTFVDEYEYKREMNFYALEKLELKKIKIKRGNIDYSGSLCFFVKIIPWCNKIVLETF